MDSVGSGDSGYSSGVKLLVAPSPAFAPFLQFSFRILHSLDRCLNWSAIGVTLVVLLTGSLGPGFTDQCWRTIIWTYMVCGRLVCFCFLPVLTTILNILTYHMLGVFNIRGWGGLISGEGITLLKSSQKHI